MNIEIKRGKIHKVSLFQGRWVGWDMGYFMVQSPRKQMTLAVPSPKARYYMHIN